MIALLAILVAANLLFALRTLDVVLRSQDAIESREGEGAPLPSLSIVVPARNEERGIARCVRSLLSQNHPDFEVVVVDDRSEDATAEILRGLRDERPELVVVGGEDLPDGWVGKPWALAQGARVARGSWLLFTDADTEHDPGSAACAQANALARRLDVLSLLTDQKMASWAERAFLPSLLFTIVVGIGATQDVNDPRKPDVAIFNGQYVLFSRAAYDAIGGHAVVRGEIAEDLELARRLKRDGRFRCALLGASGLVRTRMYRSFGEIWYGFVKNFALGSRGKLAESVPGLVLLACVSPLSPAALLWLAATGHGLAALVLAGAMAVFVAAGEYGMRRMRFPLGSALWLPVGLALALAIFLTSLLSFASGRGVSWRGRRYAPPTRWG